MIDNISWLAIYPEIVLLTMACVIALVDLGVHSPRRTSTYVLTMLTLAVVAALQGMYASSGNTFYGFGNMVVSDAMGNWLKCFATVAMMVTLVYGRPYAADRDMLRGGELFTLSMFALLGMFIMISGNNFLVIYLGLELLTLSSYALVALRRDNATATEAAMKYFVLGAMASGFLLYGLSMVYGATGSLDIGQVFKAVNSGQIKHQVLVFGLVFVVAGLAFKLGVVPFHMWIPDVYQGAPTAVTLMIGGAPKLAAFAMALRLLVYGLLGLAADWQKMLLVMAVLSIGLGNLAAIAQTNIKRMLAYSAISHMGYMVLGLMSGMVAGKIDPFTATNAYSSALYYTVAYVLMSLGAFGAILLLSRAGYEAENLEDFKGLNKRSPWFAAMMLIVMFSMAGIPFFIGFFAKFAVLLAAIKAGYVTVAVIAVMFSLVGAYYYLRVVKLMYFDAPVDSAPITAGLDVRVLFSLNGIAVAGLGLFPNEVMMLCTTALLRSV